MRTLVLILSLFCIGTANAADTARARLDAFSRGIASVSAQFEQQVSEANGGKAKTSRGTLALKSPRQLRWETMSPYHQLIVADGEKVWIYDPDLEQVTVRAQGAEEAHSPLTVLTDLSQLDRDFSTSEQGEHDGQVWLRLTSKDKEPQFEYADLGFDASGLASMAFKDTFGNGTQIRFSGWQRNPKLDAGLFRFTPPKGVDVVGDPTTATTQPLKD